MKQRSPMLLLGTGLGAAIAASLCCAGPLLLLMLGVSGAWISNLTALEPLRPYLIGLVVALYTWLYRRERCADGRSCALPKNRRRYRALFWLFSALAILLISSPYWLIWLV